MIELFGKDSAYMEALTKLRKVIAEDYQDGGWLPTARKLCQDLDICAATYTKVINRLATENVVKSYPRKGVSIVPAKLRPRKIGLVVGNGAESPYLTDLGLVSGILHNLHINGLGCHLIQGSPVVNVARSALTHYVEGLIWINPEENAEETVKYLNDNNLITLLVANSVMGGDPQATIPAGVPCVYENFTAASLFFPRMYAKRGHKNLLFNGQTWWVEREKINKNLKEYGLGELNVFYLGENNASADEVVDLIVKENITALRLEGARSRMEEVFEKLVLLPEDKQPEVMIRTNPFINQIIAKFPTIKIGSIIDRDYTKFSASVVNTLINNLSTGAKESADVESYVCLN